MLDRLKPSRYGSGARDRINGPCGESREAGCRCRGGGRTEAGGHIGEITTMNLVPQVADVISIPVIAAGGVADGRGMAAAFALGAEGVQVGTRFVCAAESNVHINYKEKIVEANDRATVVTGRSTGHPVRGLKNKLSREFEELKKAPRLRRSRSSAQANSGLLS